MYDVFLPSDVRELLLLLRFTISLGIEGIPLACIGYAGYLARLYFWTLVPLVVVGIVLLARALLSICSCRSWWSLPADVAPIALRAFFLAYPIATNVAFDAFSCYDFENGAGYLVADVSIECGGAEHAHVKSVAWAAIGIYPVGMLVLNGCLLLGASPAILAEQPTALSRAVGFLHREYKPTFFFWELCEMGRRFLLVGAFVVGPYHPGSMMQLALAALTCVLYLALQEQAMPYRLPTDNFLALCCSLSLVVLFLACIFYKLATLTELRDVQDRMSYEQREDFELPAVPLTATIIASVVGVLILSAVLIVMQAGQHAAQFERERQAAKARRLRSRDTGKGVAAPPLAVNAAYHLFL